MFGCAYWRIADEPCFKSTLRRRRDEWIACGVLEILRGLELEAYYRLIGLELSDLAVDGCIIKASYGDEKVGRSSVDRGKRSVQTLHGSERQRHPACVRRRHGQPPQSAAPSRDPGRLGGTLGGCLSGQASTSTVTTTRSSSAKGCESEGCSPSSSRRASWRLWRPRRGGWWSARTSGTTRTRSLVVCREGRTGDRLLGGVLGGGDHHEASDSGRLEALPLGSPTFPSTMIY